MAKTNSALLKGANSNPASNLRVGKIDLDTVPRVKVHLARIRGASNSEKVLLDPGLRDRAAELITQYEAWASDGSEQSLNDLRSCGFTTLDVESMRHVVDHPELWNRSRVDLDAMYSALARYGQSSRKHTKNQAAYSAALTQLRLKFAKLESSAIRPYSLTEGEIPFQPQKSSGFPLMSKKNLDELRALKEAKRLVDTDRRPPPCVASVRVQQKATGPKTRLVFAYPMSMTLIEGMFAPLVTKRIKQFVDCITYADGLEEIGQKTADARRSKFILETDFSAFDATIPDFIIRDCFSILRDGFHLDEVELKAWERMVDYFVNTPILMPDGGVYLTHRGVPSGSWFTNIIDSMVNLLSVYYCAHRVGMQGKVVIHVLGDDAIIGTSYPLDLVEWSRFASELGLDMSPEKSKVAVYSPNSRVDYTEEVPYYLGRYWTESGAWYRPMHITLARLLYHERWVAGDVRSLRLDRLASHAMDNPKASVLILHLLSGDPSERFHVLDTGRRQLVTSLYKQANKLGIDVVQASGVTGLSEFMPMRDTGVFTYHSYSENTWKGRMVPIHVNP